MKRLLSISVAALCCICYGSGKAYLTVKVVDSETAEPVPNIHVRCDFANFSRGWVIAAKDNRDDASTDAKGICRLSGFTEAGEASCVARGNAGYYNSGWYALNYQERSFLKLGRWMPDNVVVTVRLDRIVSPIPLYVKKAVGVYRHRERSDRIIDTTYKELSTALLKTNNVRNVRNATMAFDMIEGDWLPPIGNGNVADIAFTFNEDVLGWKIAEGHGVSIHKKYKMNALISIAGDGNGIVEVPSDQNAGIKLRTAPSNGYVNTLTRWRGWFGGGDGSKTDCDKNRCYAFRIRTVYDDDGNVKSAYYGKIYGDFDLSGLEGVSFIYYLNPTPNDRNLEWDMTNNVCPDPGDIGNPRP